MRLERLVLDNYRGFQHLDFAFPPGNLCVLIGKNGAGKSSILDALRNMLRGLRHNTADLPGLSADELWSAEDIRRGTELLHVLLHTDRGTVESDRHTQGTATLADGVSGELERHVSVRLPMIRYLGADRAMGDGAMPTSGPGKPPEPGTLLAWEDALEGGARSFSGFLPWFLLQENLENEQRLRRDPAFRLPSLQAVRQALSTFLSGLSIGTFTDPRFMRVDEHGQALNPGVLVFDKDGETLRLSQLSDGERMLLLIVGDLARRLFLANPGSAAPLQGAGVVLVDEIELHLHPGWQRAVLPALQATFPNLQLIVTTHSPQVLSSVPGEAVRILEGFQVFEAPPTLWRDSNSLLEEVMGDAPRPRPPLEALNEIARLLDAGEITAARARLDELAALLTEEDADLLHYRALLSFLEE